MIANTRSTWINRSTFKIKLQKQKEKSTGFAGVTEPYQKMETTFKNYLERRVEGIKSQGIEHGTAWTLKKLLSTDN